MRDDKKSPWRGTKKAGERGAKADRKAAPVRPGKPSRRMHHPQVEDEVERMQEAADTPPNGPLEG